MSYYENVYLPLMGRDGKTVQERFKNIRARQFKEGYLKKSIFRVEFAIDGIIYEGSLQPHTEKEGAIYYTLFLPLDSVLSTGQILEIENRKWLVTFDEPSWETGHNTYKVYLLNRILTWWNGTTSLTSPVSFLGKMDSKISDLYKRVNGSLSTTELTNNVNVILPFISDYKQGLYAKIDQSDRRFLTQGYDAETVPGVIFATLDLTLSRTDSEQIKVPSSFWKV